MAEVWLDVVCMLLFFGLIGRLHGKGLDEPGLICGDDGMRYTIPKSQIGDVTPMLMVLDKKGGKQVLYEDLICGSNLTEQADGSLIITSLYEGCYVSHRNNSFVMVILISYKDDYGAWKVPEQKELRCQIRPAMDAPSPGQCSTFPKTERLLCGQAPITSDLCQSQGCCYDPSDSVNTCYYSNKVTTQCTSNGTFSVAVSKYATTPPLLLNSVKLTRATDQSCTPLASSSSFLLFQFPLSSCGTTVKSVGSQVVYENELVAKRTVQVWQGSYITRDSTFKLTVRCSLSLSSYLPLNVNVFTLSPPYGVSSLGPLKLELRIAKDAQYDQYYTDGDYPIVKFLRDPVFVEVHILQRTDPQLALVLQQCWATPSADPFQQMQWPMLLDGCPFEGDNYGTLNSPIDQSLARLNFPSFYKRFVVSTFTFVDASSLPLQGQVYFHCSASVCVQSATQQCKTSCASRRRRSLKPAAHHPDLHLVSSHGPVFFQVTLENQESWETFLKAEETRKPADSTSIPWLGAAVAIGIICVAVAAVGLWRFIGQRKFTVTLVNI
ncbi:zona pellucida sperm-binding protein 4-like [Pelodytes ibericus]